MAARGHSLKGKAKPRKAAVMGRLTKAEKAFCQTIAEGHPVAFAERKQGWATGYGYQVLRRPRVDKFLSKLVNEVERKEIEKLSDHIADALTLADQRLYEILSSPVHSFHAYRDHLRAIELAFKRHGALEDKKPTAPQTPGESAAAAIAATQVNIHLPSSSAEQGEMVYHAKWIRDLYGIASPTSDAIDAKFGGTERLPHDSIALRRDDARDEMGTENGTSVEGAELES